MHLAPSEDAQFGASTKLYIKDGVILDGVLHTATNYMGHEKALIKIIDWPNFFFEELKCRRSRETEIGFKLSSDPAWDMMLSLMRASLIGEENTIENLSQNVGLPLSIGYRWIKVLEKRGVVHLEIDNTDERRFVVTLTDQSYFRLANYFNLWLERSILSAQHLAR